MEQENWPSFLKLQQWTVFLVLVLNFKGINRTIPFKGINSAFTWLGLACGVGTRKVRGVWASLLAEILTH